MAGTGLAEARYIRLTGTDSSAAGGSNGFDLDAVGLVHWRHSADGTEPGHFLRLLTGDVTGTNTVGFVNTRPGVYPDQVTVQFDLRISRSQQPGRRHRLRVAERRRVGRQRPGTAVRRGGQPGAAASASASTR